MKKWFIIMIIDNYNAIYLATLSKINVSSWFKFNFKRALLL